VGLDLNAMTTTGGRAFVLEVMGRNAGGWPPRVPWLPTAGLRPHIILLPEVPFDEGRS
jgi:6-phosphofructokinase 1